MEKRFIVANWKSNKTVGEAEEWIKQVSGDRLQVPENIEIVLCPPFTLLALVHSQLKAQNLPFALGAQDVSPFPEGAYTGEVSARNMVDLGVKYVIIGHSERRKYFQEDEPVLTDKVRESLDAGLTPIFCVQGKTTPIPAGVKIIAYEPVAAIGTGQPDSPENADEVARVIKEKIGPEAMVLYGGSVNEGNAANFCQQENLNGVLVGGASLEADKFLKILENASQI